jgi:hypothetical protein
MRELKRLLAACGDRDVWIMEVLPRFIIAHCCDNATHCTNVRQEGQAGTLACRKILADLADLNAMFGAHLTSPKVKMVATGDLLAGVNNDTSGQLMDSMYSSWNLDPVHGEKVAYTRIGLSLLDIIRKDPPPGSRGTASAPGRGHTKTTAHPAAPERRRGVATTKIEAATGGRTPLPAGRVAPPTPSTLAISTAEGTAPRAARAATTTSRVV